MKKRNLMLALMLSVSFIYSAINGPTAEAAKVINQGETVTLPNENYPTSNQSSVNGGAITLGGNLTTNGVKFDSNQASSMGGSIYQRTGGTANIHNTEFTNNKAVNGGSFLIVGKNTTTLIDEGSVFKNNTATNWAGAIYTNSNDLKIKNSRFEGNSAKIGGGIFIGDGNTYIENTTFKGNFGNESGAIHTVIGTDNNKNYITTIKTVINDCIFEDNYATGLGAGAIGNYIAQGINGDGGMTITNTKFINNKSLAKGASAVGGGAMHLGSESITKLDNVTFEGNTSTTAGGAIATRISNNGDNKDSKLDIINSTFKHNEAATNGGAIDNYFHGSKEGEADSINIVNTIFDTNKAKLGGAIYNHSDGAKDKLGGSINLLNSTFINNNAQDGGALYNDTNATLSVGTGSIFYNNTAVKGGGAIKNYTDAILKVADGVIFTNNTVTEAAGGAIQNMGTATLGNNLVFDGNKAAWGGAAVYGGSRAGKGSTTVIGDNAVFTNNILTAEKSYGGAIYVENDENYKGGHQDSVTSLKIGNNAYFAGNQAYEGGAALIEHEVDVQIGSGAIFEKNTATNYGGAIETYSGFDLKDATFSENKASIGGALFLRGGLVNLDNAKFIGNTAEHAGAIYTVVGSNTNVQTIIKNSLFENNKAGAVGAVGNFSAEGINGTGGMTIENTVFRNNQATDAEGSGAGALFLGAKSVTKLKDVTFDSNYSAADGGAIAGREYTIGNNAAAKLDIDGATFIGNNADGKGGAIYNSFYNSENYPNAVSIKNAIFNGNKAGSDGGAIYNEIEDRAGNLATVAIEDSSFVNNSAKGKGGAIFANSDLTVAAKNKDVVFAGNKASDGGDIYMNKAGSTLKFDLDNEKVVTIQDGISGNENKYNIAIDGFGNIDLQSYIKNANVNVNDATLWLNTGSQINGLNNHITMNNESELITINNQIDKFDEGLFTLNGNVDLAVDVDLATGKTDFFKNAIKNDSTGKFVLEGVKPIANTTNNIIQINLYDALGLDKNSLEINPSEFVAMKALTPIRYLSGSVSQDGILTYAPAGNSYKDFNPSVMAAPVAAQLGGYLTQLNSYDEAFRNMDMYMLMTKKQRQAMKLRNKYAAAEGMMTFDPNQTPYTNKAGWFRPYATFENVSLKGGPRVSNVAYGSFFGAESEMYDLGHGWDGMWGAYIGYNGSHQSFNGISMYQNGGTLGAVGMAYKGNFYTGLTINAGANGVEANTMYGTDNFSMLMAGIASKTGYNIELADGKFIIQPNFMMSYSFVNTFDYTNAAGVRINSSPLNAIQIEPGIKFIGNLKNGWQPYLGVSMVWNIMDKTQFNANNVSLPDLSIKPFVRYGIGVRKTWGERITGFFQCYFTNGGRNGVGLQAGFRMTVGKTPNSIHKQSSTPQLKKTEIKLGCNK